MAARPSRPAPDRPSRKPTRTLKCPAESADVSHMTRTALHRLRPAADEDEDGFTLVEVLVAVVVLAVMSLAAFSGLVTSLRTSTSSRVRTVATALAAQEIDAYDAVELVPSIPVGTTARNEPIGGRTYRITTTTAWVSVPVAASVDRCAGPSTGTYSYLKVSVLVAGPAGTPSVGQETLLAPRAGTGPTGKVTQRVRVLDRTATKRNGVAVTLTPLTAGASPVTTLSTGTDGCVLFPGLADGSYRVSTSTLNDEVGVAGSQVASQDVTLSSSATPRLVELLYDRSASIEVAMGVNADYPRVPKLPVTAVNSGVQPAGRVVRTWASGSSALPTTTTRAGTLFPFLSGYQVFMGGCPDNDPALYGLTSPVAAPAPAGRAGVPTPLTVPAGGAWVSVQTNDGKLVDGATIDAHDSCGGHYRLSGSTSSSGSDKGFLRAALPLGFWTFTVVTWSGGVNPAVTTSPTDAVRITPQSSTASNVQYVTIRIS